MKQAILVVLGIAAVFGAIIFMQNKPQVVSSTSELTTQVQDRVGKQVDDLKSAAVEARAEIKVAAETLTEQAQEVDPEASIAAMEVTAYEPEFEELVYTDKGGNKHVFKIEMATKLAEVQKGLMFRRSMPEDQGMLFVFPNEQERGFWMKNTYIPLDMIFINSDGSVHKVHKGAVPLDTSIIHSEGPVKYVLEVNAGVADKLGMSVGDKFDHEIFINKLAE